MNPSSTTPPGSGRAVTCVASVDGVVDATTRRRREFDSAQVLTAVATASIGLRLEGLRVERLLSLEASPIVLSVSRVASGSEKDCVFVDVRVESLREASHPGVVSVLLEKNVSMPDEVTTRCALVIYSASKKPNLCCAR